MKLDIDQTKIDIIKKWLGSGSINVFGMPLAGKDTQCHRLADLLSAATFGGGDILRNSKVSSTLQAEIDLGKLAPTDEYRAIVLPYFQRSEFNDKPLVLSSVGRWTGEEVAVLEAANNSGHPMKAAVFLQLSEANAKARLDSANRGRADDEAHKLHTRFQEFATKTNPVINVYQQQDLLLKVDGDQDIDTVTEAIINALCNKAKSALRST